ncbi:MAG: PIG-L family deacetylase [Bacteroidetes bacterium]|nr:PIG-L family deacetylase [Bacteroidota bacterium]
MEKLQNPARVLYIAAHPDDENTRLISWLVNAKKCRTAYLSLTRGDGGQNLIGTEKSELLGLIRTEELLAARRVDGAEQYFSRAIDFGYSKNPQETFEKWGREEMLNDVVWVIRNFKPDIVITRFPTTGEGGHGHHTASAIVAKEAFEAAADPKQFPWQLQYTETWQAKRLLWNNFMPFRDPTIPTGEMLSLDVGDYNPLLGKSYGEIASESRSMHKSQGFGAARGRGPQLEYFTMMAGTPAVNDIFEGVNTSLAKADGAAALAKTIAEIINKYKPSAPQESVKGLVNAHVQASQLKDVHIRNHISQKIEHLILNCSGLWVEAIASQFYCNPAEKITLNVTALMRNPGNVSLKRVVFSTGQDTVENWALKPHQPLIFPKTILIPQNAGYSMPFWLKNQPGEGLWQFEDSTMLARPKGPNPVEAEFHFNVENITIRIKRPVVYKWVDPVEGELYRDLEIIPEAMVNFNRAVNLFPDNKPQKVSITVRAGKDSISGTAGISLPRGWVSSPASREFSLLKKNEEQVLEFEVTHSVKAQQPKPVKVRAWVNTEAGRHSYGMGTIDYKHIPKQTLVKEYEAVFTPLQAAVKPLKVAYIPGADDLPEYLQQLGLNIRVLDVDALETIDFAQFDVIVTGIRAFNMHDKLRLVNRKLLTFVENGGNMVVQYNTSNFTGVIDFSIGPYPFKISRNRVTDENASVSFVKPEHPVLNKPNQIQQHDFEGWVQERGLYFAGDIDERYQKILEMADPGEQPQQGSLIVADYGKGSFIYTGISFFRQLPAGVPGAYRLFANLISYQNEAGKGK